MKPTPSPASSVPDRKSKAHDHQYRQHKTWSTHATCEICGFAVSKSTLFLDQNVFDSQLSNELVKERRNPSVPASLLEAVGISYRSGGSLVPVVVASPRDSLAELYATRKVESMDHSPSGGGVIETWGLYAGKAFHLRLCPSPAEPVKVLGGESRFFDAFQALIADAKAMDVRLLQGQPDPGCEKGSIARARVALKEAMEERAAHLAKIQALTEALKGLLDYYENKGSAQGFPVHLCPEHADARAARSLPSA